MEAGFVRHMPPAAAIQAIVPGGEERFDPNIPGTRTYNPSKKTIVIPEMPKRAKVLVDQCDKFAADYLKIAEKVSDYLETNKPITYTGEKGTVELKLKAPIFIDILLKHFHGYHPDSFVNGRYQIATKMVPQEHDSYNRFLLKYLEHPIAALDDSSNHHLHLFNEKLKNKKFDYTSINSVLNPNSDNYVGVKYDI